MNVILFLIALCTANKQKICNFIQQRRFIQQLIPHTYYVLTKRIEIKYLMVQKFQISRFK